MIVCFQQQRGGLGEIAGEIALGAQEDGRAVGVALARRRTPSLATLTDLYVRQDARRSGVATELMRDVLTAVAEGGAHHDFLVAIALGATVWPAYLLSRHMWGGPF